MKTDDLENKLRNLKFLHLSESELVAYCDQEPDQMRRARMETHLNQCFICKRQLELLREESAALSNRENTAADIAFVERLMEQTESAQKPSEIPLQERLAEYLQQMVVSWRSNFMAEARRGITVQEEEMWRWQSDDGKLQARAIMENNADLTVHFSSNDMDMEGARLNFRLGSLSQEITLRRVSESEIAAKVAIPWWHRRGGMADISIENL